MVEVKKNGNPEGRGRNDFGIGRVWGVKHFGISEGKGRGRLNVHVACGGVWVFSGTT